MNKTEHSFGENIIIYDGAKVHSSCDIGPFSIIYPGEEIEANVQIGSSCIIGKKPKIGKNQTKLSTIEATMYAPSPE